MPNKPDKFGIKFWMLCDSDTKYDLRLIPYLGKDEGEHTVKELMRPF